MKKNIPNILTLSRFVLIPFIIVSLVCNKYLIAFILLTISGLTDVLDGFIARKFNFITDFGKLIDPLADKATQLSILITLSLKTTSIPTSIYLRTYNICPIFNINATFYENDEPIFHIGHGDSRRTVAGFVQQ